MGNPQAPCSTMGWSCWKSQPLFASNWYCFPPKCAALYAWYTTTALLKYRVPVLMLFPEFC